MNKIIGTAARVHSFCEKALSHLQSPLLLAVRLYWGWQFFQTGYGKLMHINKVVGFFMSLGIPFPAFNAYFVSYLECLGGALLFLGLGSRVIALPLTIDMLVAYIAADREALFSIFSDPGKFYGRRPFYILLRLSAHSRLRPGKNFSRFCARLCAKKEDWKVTGPAWDFGCLRYLIRSIDSVKCRPGVTDMSFGITDGESHHDIAHPGDCVRRSTGRCLTCNPRLQCATASSPVKAPN